MTLALATSGQAIERAIVTICSNNYLHYGRVLFSSLQKYHPEATLFLCLADIKQPEIELEIDGVEVIEARKLAIPNFSDFAFRYDIMEFNTAVKPFVMRYLIEELGFEQVVYLDPDIELFAPMTPVFAALEAGANFVLTPHLTSPAESLEFPNDIGIMKSGVYNLGFIALSDDNDVIDFLHWWGRRLRFQCLNQQDRGIFVDQKFVDLLPGFHDRVAILRDPALNVAYWNIEQRKLELGSDGWSVEGKPLIFFHFSGIDPNNPDRLSKHTARFNGNLEPALKSLIEHYISGLKRFGFLTTIKSNYEYGTFSNKVAIADVMRRYYRTLEEPWLEDPFQTFFDHLNLPYWQIKVNSPWLVTNLMHYLWSEIPELREAYPLKTIEGCKNYVYWFIENARDYGIDSYFLLPILDNVTERVTQMRRVRLPNKTKKWQADAGVIGYLKAETGVGQAGRMLARSLEAVGLKTTGFNISADLVASQQVRDVEELLSSTINAKVNIYSVNADRLAIVRQATFQSIDSAGFNVNVPFWELSKFPAEWVSNYDGIDEIWASSRFVQAALQPAFSIPVVWMPAAVEIGNFTRSKRDRWNLPADAFLFHFNFDFSSYSARKNPSAAIAAYRIAFRHRRADTPTALVIKTRGLDPQGKNLQTLKEFTEGESDIFIINEEMTHADTIGLMNCCDCYISLHRSEGFGYTIAEAMLLSKPVIATDYSGNKDFLDNSTGYPVNYRLQALDRDEYPFWAGQKWAEPDLNHAAWLMRRIVSDRVATRSIAEAGRQKILSEFSLQASGKRYLDRLRLLGVL